MNQSVQHRHTALVHPCKDTTQAAVNTIRLPVGHQGEGRFSLSCVDGMTKVRTSQ